MNSLIPIPQPVLDQPILSEDTCREEHKCECDYTDDHDRDLEVESEWKAAELASRIFSIKINGKSSKMTPNLALYNDSKRISENDYVVSCNHPEKIQKQVSETSCWAACIQYLVAARYNKEISQEEIIEKIKKKNVDNNEEVAGDVIDIVNGLGFAGLTYTHNGSHQLLKTLADGQPVMIGLLPEDGGSMGHAVVVTEARYSFTSHSDLSCLTCGSSVFKAFTILDPWTAETKLVKAEEIEKRIYFVISYSPKQGRSSYF